MKLQNLRAKHQNWLSATLLGALLLAATTIVVLPAPASAAVACYGHWETGCTSCQFGTAKWCYVCDVSGYEPNCTTQCGWQWLPC